jgi:hypothetical protein
MNACSAAIVTSSFNFYELGPIQQNAVSWSLLNLALSLKVVCYNIDSALMQITFNT